MKKIIKIANIVFYIVILILFIYFVFQINSKKDIKKNIKKINKVEEKREYKEFANKNFRFEYILEIDNIKTIYRGENNKNKAHFIYKSTKEESEYYLIEDIFLKYHNKNYILTNNPSLYFNFFDIEKIKAIIYIIKQVKIDLTNFANLYKSNSKVTLILNYSDYNKINEININK